ncbi:MAG: glycosyltransferase family 2 protein, partial [Dysgonamonadaceae bacterium]|nr:glycosyltransferase family 2 protein [Dysgonamonadaceae bacterium]
MENTTISVVVPVFNGEKYIAQVLENLLFQTYKHLEIIVINDGSTDS